MPRGDPCAVADQFCLAAANFEPPQAALGVCYRCGMPVCSKCSTRRKYLHYGLKRLCNNCQIGNEKRVRARLYRMAGYPGGRRG